MVCKLITATGSRVGGKRVCKTAGERAAQRLQDREAGEQGQRTRPMDANGAVGAPVTGG